MTNNDNNNKTIQRHYNTAKDIKITNMYYHFYLKKKN